MHGDRLFDVTEYDPNISIADRLQSVHEVSRATVAENAAREIKRMPPYLQDKLAALAAGSTIVIHGVEFNAREINPLASR